MMFLSNLVPSTGDMVNSRTLLSPEPCLMNCPCSPASSWGCHPSCGGKGCKMETAHFSFPLSLLDVSGCNVGFYVPLALPGCREWGHFGAGSTAGPPALPAPTPLSAAAPQAKGLYLGQVFLMSVKFPWLHSKSTTCHIPMIYSLHFCSSFFS